MTSKNTKSSEVLKQEVLVQLDKIDTDIDQMGMRLTPGQMIDDVIYYPRGGSPAATFDLLKANPIGATFLTLGTMMLMEDENHQTYESIARTRASGIVAKGRDRYDQVSGSIDDLRDKIATQKTAVTEKISGLKSKVQERVAGTSAVDVNRVVAFDGRSTEVSDIDDNQRMRAIEDAKVAFGADSAGVSGKINELSGKVNEIGDKIKESGTQLAGNVTGRIDDLKDKVPDVSEVKEKISGVIGSAKESLQGQATDGIEAVKGMDPVMYVAVGAGLGALTGLSLPVPDSEAEFAGQFDGTITSFAQDLQSALNESAGVLKDLVISDFKNLNVDVFKR